MLWCPGISWGFGALLKGTSVMVLRVEKECCTFPPPTYNSCRPETRTRNLSITSPTLWPLTLSHTIIAMQPFSLVTESELKLHFNCYKKHVLTRLSLVIMTVLDYIVFTHYNSPFACYCYHEMHILIRFIALHLFSAHARSSSSTRVSPLLTAKWIYLYDFLTFRD